MTHFQQLLAFSRTAAEDCYDSFPLRAQEFIFSPSHFYSSSVTLIFSFFRSFFGNAVIQAALIRFGGAEKLVKNITFFKNIT